MCGRYSLTSQQIELATVRLRNMSEVLGHWRTYVWGLVLGQGRFWVGCRRI
ncbi:hypothetical protein [Synechococcus sp. 1G10]|uniref:hypothetical protein n=1 Tax=Synechococcus sp. 1G10 TaxID=2025605 RepID=UPI0013031C51|nr:hypothetical protein [Synechococcus sp. 1G10]